MSRKDEWSVTTGSQAGATRTVLNLCSSFDLGTSFENCFLGEYSQHGQSEWTTAPELHTATVNNMRGSTLARVQLTDHARAAGRRSQPTVWSASLRGSALGNNKKQMKKGQALERKRKWPSTYKEMHRRAKLKQTHNRGHVTHMSAPKRSLSKGARSAPRPFSCRRAARSGPLRRAQAIVIRL